MTIGDCDPRTLGYGVPAEHAELELAKRMWNKIGNPFHNFTIPNVDLGWQEDPLGLRPDWRDLPSPDKKLLGTAMMTGGVLLASPGISYFHVPFTGWYGIAFNIAGGAILFGAGYYIFNS
ncbi:TPA: hypothetical protein EYN23_12805 [Candidatus Poribacteria bacterium]|nr:hypothetical protein [Candidatus Poribacteria bacterium]